MKFGIKNDCSSFVRWTYELVEMLVFLEVN